MKCCVYTCITGDYEKLNDQFESMGDVDLICLTDSDSLKSKVWNVEKIKPFIVGNRHMSHRHVKCCPKDYPQLSYYDVTVYMDNRITANSLVRQACDYFIKSKSQIGLLNHSYRSSLFEEFQAVLQGKHDNPSNVSRIFDLISKNFPELLVAKPFWGGAIFRNMREEVVHTFGKTWFSLLLLGSQRDQLSLQLSLHLNNIRPLIIPENIFSSYFHKWPTEVGRQKVEVQPDAEIRPIDSAVIEGINMKSINEKLILDNEIVRLKALVNSHEKPTLIMRLLRKISRLMTG